LNDVIAEVIAELVAELVIAGEGPQVASAIPVDANDIAVGVEHEAVVVADDKLLGIIAELAKQGGHLENGVVGQSHGHDRAILLRNLADDTGGGGHGVDVPSLTVVGAAGAVDMVVNDSVAVLDVG